MTADPGPGVVIICSRIDTEADDVVPGSVRRHCSVCQVAVWVSPSSMVQLAGGAVVACIGCVVKEMQGRFEAMPLSPLQLHELEAWAERRRGRR